jgi:hypothetical protein
VRRVILAGGEVLRFSDAARPGHRPEDVEIVLDIDRYDFANLFAPALAQAGLKSDRVIYLEAGDDKSVLACFEEALRRGGLGGVVAEVARLPMIFAAASSRG